ncbi:MAG: hypothetical protein ACRD9R_06615 [Pyrinomonadaceae bacterium]
MNKRLEKIAREQRQTMPRLDRIGGAVLITRANVAELQDRVHLGWRASRRAPD